MRIIAIGVSLFILISTGCKNSTDIVIGEKEITKIDLKEKESTIYFSESENETKYNMVIISAPKDDEFQDISINVDFEPGNKEPSSESIMSYDENYNDSSEDMAETLEESFTLRETDDLPPKRKFNIPEDSSDELFPTEKIGENENFVLYKDERVSNNFDKDEYFKALENIEYRLKHFAGDVSDEDQNGGRIIFVFTKFDKEYLGGVFHTEDLGEILYIAGQNSLMTIFSNMAHEFLHAIHYNYQHIIPTKNKKKSENIQEAFGIKEGLAHLMEDLCGYSGNLIGHVARYLANISTTSLKAFPPMVTGESGSNFENSTDEEVEWNRRIRGGNYLFFRYLYEQLGEDIFIIQNNELHIESNRGGDFIRALIQSTEVGYEKIEKLFGRPFEELLLNFGITLSIKKSTKDEYAFKEPQKDEITGNTRGVKIYSDESLEFDDKQHGKLNGPAIIPLQKKQDLKVPHYGVMIFSFTVPKRYAREMSMKVSIKNTKANIKVGFVPIP